MSLMSRIHEQLLKRGLLDSLLPACDDTDDDRPALEEAKADLEKRQREEEKARKDVNAAIWKLHELNRNNHYGESLRKAFGGV